MKTKLSDAKLRKWPKVDKRVEVRDLECPQLVVRVAPDDARTISFCAVYRVPGAGRMSPKTGNRLARQVRATIGHYPTMSLADARKTARDMAAEAKATRRDPNQQVKEARKRTMDALWPDFKAYMTEQRKAVSFPITENYWRLYVKGTELAALPLDQVRGHEVHKFITALGNRRTQRTANECWGRVFKRFFSWARQSGHVDIDPLHGISYDFVPNKRGWRVPDPLLHLYWKAAVVQGYPFGDIFRLCMLTGMRRSEVAHLTEDEVDLQAREIVLPACRLKVGRANKTVDPDAVFVVPITDLVHETLMDVYEKRRLLEPKGPYLFTKAGAQCTEPPVAFSKAGLPRDKWVATYVAKHKLDVKLPDKANGEKTVRPHHEMRHTMKTIMKDLGTIQGEIIHACAGHTEIGIDAVYGHSAFRVQKRHAFEEFHHYLKAVIDGSFHDGVFNRRTSAV